MTLNDFLGVYFLQHQLAPTTEENFRYTVQNFERLLGKSVKISELNADAINEYLRALQNLGRSQSTLKNRRTNLLVLWRKARRLGYNKHDMDNVRRLKPHRQIVLVWSHLEVTRLYQVAQSWIGKQWLPDGADEGLYWSAYIAASWDSGLRRSDVFEISIATLSETFSVVQRKTGNPVRVELRKESIDLIRRLNATGPTRMKPFQWTGHLRNFSKRAKVLIQEAGLEGSMRYLRRGCATAIASQFQRVDLASDKLGHRSEKITIDHYLAAQWKDRPSTLPPSLENPE